MVTDLPQLHDGVHQCLCASFTLGNTMRLNVQREIAAFLFFPFTQLLVINACQRTFTVFEK